MNPPAAGVWLDAWERGMSAPPALRPAVLLEAYHGAGAQPSRWSLGRREAGLLRLRGVLFGNAMDSVAACPHCGELMEFTVRAGELLSAAPEEIDGRVEVAAAGLRAEFRLPDSEDLAAAALVPRANRRQFLLQRCLLDAPPSDGAWPEEFIAAASREMGEADPLGDVNLALACPECDEAWSATFDTGAFLWSELCAWAARLMSEIHLLAAAYGWTEAEIIALPPHRRGFYLDRIGQS